MDIKKSNKVDSEMTDQPTIANWLEKTEEEKKGIVDEEKDRANAIEKRIMAGEYEPNSKIESEVQ